MDFSNNGRYIGKKEKEKVFTLCIEHQQDRIKGNWESPDAIEDTKECQRQFNWSHLRIIAIMPNMYKRKVREAFEINRLKTLNEIDKKFKVPNMVSGDYVITNS